MRIAVFDYRIDRNNPTGGCHLRMLRALAREHEFTVFAVTFDNPCPERITWVRVPAPGRPLPLLFIFFHLFAPILYWLHRAKTGKRFDLVQMVESNLSFGTVSYSHFCHTSYLKHHWGHTQATGWRGLSRWLDHRLHAGLEERIYSAAQRIVVPSRGLAGELAAEFPGASRKIRVLPNAVDVSSLQRPSSFDRVGFREQLGLSPSDVVFVFVALGHFERKGLPILMEALARLQSKSARLLVVGGTRDLIESYRARVKLYGLKDRISFVGMQSDVRPYLWAADAFAFASTYETFSLVAFEAAAASLPLITPLLHGVQEITTHGETGFIVNRTVEDFALALSRFTALPDAERAEMGRRARLAALKYDDQRFVDNWRLFYRDWNGSSTLTAPPAASEQSVGTF